jgi:hypothetical protein
MRTAACLLLGALVGFCGAFIQTLVLASGRAPLGAVASLIAAFLVARAVAWWAGTRAAGATFLAGWLAASIRMGTTTSGADLVLTNGTRELFYLGLGCVILSAAASFPLLPASQKQDEPS